MLVSVVIPCFNEEEVLPATQQRLAAVLARLEGFEYEIVYIDDGSRDKTALLLQHFHHENPRVRVLQLSRNFGHQIALTAGLEHASGDVIIIIDADLQDPPELIPDMLAKWRDGYEVVYMVRTDRLGETRFKRATANLFYRFINQLSEVKIPMDTGDFRLMDRRALDALLSMPEHHRFIRGMVAWVGFRQVALPYQRAPRAAGSTKYPFTKMLRFAMDAIVSFSSIPLRFVTFIGFLAIAAACLGVIYALIMRLFIHIYVPGWTLLFMATMLIGGLQLMGLGIMGEYLGRIYVEAKHRPLYFLQSSLGFSDSTAPGQNAVARRTRQAAKG